LKVPDPYYLLIRITLPVELLIQGICEIFHTEWFPKDL
jgi:hypothetical protein